MSLKEVLENNHTRQRHLKENNVDIRKLILDNKCDLLVKALTERVGEPPYVKDRSTPIMFAAIVGNLEAVRLLITDNSCDINAQDVYGMTALMYAIVCGQNDVVKLLLHYSADVFRRTNDHCGAFSALEIAYFSRCFDLEILRQIHQRFSSRQPTLTSSTTSLDRAFTFGLGKPKRDWINKFSRNFGLADASSDASEQAQNRKKEFLIEIGQSHVDWSRPDRFVLPVELMMDDKKVERVREMRTDEYTFAARRLAFHCYSNGVLLKDFPIGMPSTSLESTSRLSSRLASSYGSYRLHSSEGSRSFECSGSFASVAQQIAFDFDKHVKERRMRKFPVKKTSLNGSSSLGSRPLRLGTHPTRPFLSPMIVRAKIQCPNSPSTQSLRHFSTENSASSFLHPSRSISKNSLAPNSRLMPSVFVQRSISASHLRTRSTPDPDTGIPIERIWDRLEHAQLGSYRSVFEREEFDADTLISLTEEDLKKIGIHNYEHRHKIFKIIRAFQCSLT
ncbi:hypothetical protein L596_007877 [Steinernema carpocapsae]|uniref:SAM domain-containing protein n=1 Tax=Steinernema carpocapsae TaxID=34508 RepID=A0A4U5PAX2_STECR|nr:hypothetical protein L596_007877 [Steinernema carpocapsae]